MHLNINGYLSLVFKCIKDINCTLKHSLTWIIKEGNHIVIFLFSKEVLVGVFIFLKSNYIERNVNPPSFLSSEVYQSCITKSNTSRFLTSPSRIHDYIFEARGVYYKFTNDKQEKLVKTILAKPPQNNSSEISIK